MLVWSFVVPFILLLLGLSTLRHLMSWTGGCFDRFGTVWIVLKSVYYGCLGLLIYHTAAGVVNRSKSVVPMLVITTTAIGLNLIRTRNSFDPSYTILDGAITKIGYAVSRIKPYEAKDEPTPTGYSPAIPPNTAITTKSSETLSIRSGRGLMRTFDWDGQSRSIQLIPEQIERGVMGYCFPKDEWKEQFPGDVWREHEGIARCRYREGVREFKNEDEAIQWINTMKEHGSPLKYTSTGLLVAWSKTDGGFRTLIIDIWQILINGKKPGSLPGSSDRDIVVEQSTERDGAPMN